MTTLRFEASQRNWRGKNKKKTVPRHVPFGTDGVCVLRPQLTSCFEKVAVLAGCDSTVCFLAFHLGHDSLTGNNYFMQMTVRFAPQFRTIISLDDGEVGEEGGSRTLLAGREFRAR